MVSRADGHAAWHCARRVSRSDRRDR